MTLLRRLNSLKQLQYLKDIKAFGVPRASVQLRDTNRGYGMYDPVTYETLKSGAERDANEFVPKLIKTMKWKTDETILDYGCGAGSTGINFLVPEAEIYNSYIKAVDSSEVMIKYAKDNYSHPRVSYIVGNIMEDNFPLLNLQFDRIFAIFVLHFIKNYETALRRFYRILKPGGQFGFIVATKPEYFQLYKILGNSENWSQYMKGYEKYIPVWIEKEDNIQQCFQQSLTTMGYRILDVKTHERSYTFDDIDLCSKLFSSSNPFLNRIPSTMHEKLRLDYKQQMLQWADISSSIQGNTFTMHYHLLYCLAEKPPLADTN